MPEGWRCDNQKPYLDHGCSGTLAMLRTLMFSKIKAFLDGADATADGDESGDDSYTAAAVAVLVEAAFLDGNFDDSERATIAGIMVDRFGLSAEDATKLIDDAAGRAGGANNVYAATRIIKDEFSDAERIDVVEMLWEVAYADGQLHDYEANLVRRVAGLLYVKDRDSGQARKQVLQRLGLEDTE